MFLIIPPCCFTNSDSFSLLLIHLTKQKRLYLYMVPHFHLFLTPSCSKTCIFPASLSCRNILVFFLLTLFVFSVVTLLSFCFFSSDSDISEVNSPSSSPSPLRGNDHHPPVSPPAVRDQEAFKSPQISPERDGGDTKEQQVHHPDGKVRLIHFCASLHRNNL